MLGDPPQGGGSNPSTGRRRGSWDDGGGAPADSESHVAPAPPPTDPEKPALPVTLPSPSLRTQESRASGPRIQVLAPPEAPNPAPGHTISPGGMQVTPPPTPTRPGIYPPKSKNLGFPPPLFAQRERGRGHEIEGFPPQSQSQWSRLLWKQTPPRQTKTRRATGTKTRCPERQAQSGRSRERQRLAGQRARRSGRNRDGSCGQVLSHTATGNHRNSGTPRSRQTGRHPARGAEITESGRKR